MYWRADDITLPRKVCIVKAMVFPVVLYGCESCTVKKAEHQRIGAFESPALMLEKILESPCTAKRSNQSILKEINPKYSLKDWCWSWSSNTWPPDAKNQLIGRGPDAGKDWGQKEKGGGRGWDDYLDRFTDSVDMSEQAPGDGEGQGSLVCCSPWDHKEFYTTEWLTSIYPGSQPYK